jgi:hypothetical protein
VNGRTRRIGDAERRARLGARHHLAAGAAAGPVEVARDLVALHSTDAATVYLAIAARSGGATPDAVERALYDDRSLIRMLAMRRTVFVVPVELAPAVLVAASRGVAARNRKLLVRQLTDAGVPEDANAGGAAAWLAEVEASVHRALLARGEATAVELSGDEPRLRTQIGERGEKAYQVPQAITSRVLNLMSMDGLIVRGRPRGSWTSTQYRWSPVERWLPGGLPEVAPVAAGAALARAYLAAYGPATVADLRWWTGWTVTETRRALTEVAPVEVALDNGDTGLVLPDDDLSGGTVGGEPRAVLLPALDPSLMGWADRSFFLGAHGPALFDRNGNAAPTVWWDGRIIGGWAQRADGEIAWRLLEDAGSGATAAAADAAARLSTWLGPVRLAPRARGRPPLEQELVG